MATLKEQFDVWAEREGVRLLPRQQEFMKLLLEALEARPPGNIVSGGFGLGKTFTLHTLDRFLDSLPQARSADNPHLVRQD